MAPGLGGGRPGPMGPGLRGSWWLQRACLLQQLLHSGPALACGFLWRASPVPVSLQTYCEAISILLESTELPRPVDEPAAHRCPVVLLAFFHDIFAVAVPDAVFRQKLVPVGIWDFATRGSVTWIPIQHECRGLHRGENPCRLGSGRGVAGRLVFQNKNQSTLATLLSRFPQFVIHRRPIGALVFQAPEIEAAHAIGVECLRHFDGSIQDFILLFPVERSAETFRLAELRFGSTGPIDLK